MARLARVEAFAPDEIAIVHVMNRVVRRCFLMGYDEASGKNYGHRKLWVESELKRLASGFGIDLLTFAIMSNHFHLILRSRPDIVALWDDTEVAKRWLSLCPIRKERDGSAAEPNESELDTIRLNPARLRELRTRLSDISWWMRLLSQRIAQRANKEDDMSGKFWQSRYRAVRLIDEEAVLACSAYVDLNPIRAGEAQTIEDSRFTSAATRLIALASAGEESVAASTASETIPVGSIKKRSQDDFLTPMEIDERSDSTGPRASAAHDRCSDKGFVSMPVWSYLELLDWTARQLRRGRTGATPLESPLLLERLKLNPSVWCALVTRFGKLFSVVAGHPSRVDSYRSRLCQRRYRLRQETRDLLAV